MVKKIQGSVSYGHSRLMQTACCVVLGWGLTAVVSSAEQPLPGVSLTNLAEQLPLEQLGQIPIESVSTA
ncbi:MAG: hypothetical protein NTY53_03415, partial [Kiritimatiellaeota bacterium]|nr:hypothetical protein [Kiritimatiellota bacterium]